ncbi:hypothetical protein EIP86_002300 [Pleurotus ostreatoroseus]|nr:hypothetical protein EIP86_002300 [Pleurotus ostreatoroseus]
MSKVVSTAPPVDPTPPAPKSRYERLENRINELESLLKDKGSPSTSTSPPADNDTTIGTLSELTDFGLLPDHGNSTTTDNVSIDISPFYINGAQLDFTFGDATSVDPFTGIETSLADTPPQTAHISSISPSDTPSAEGQSTTSPQSNPDFSLLYLSWPANLPDILTTRHL